MWPSRSGPPSSGWAEDGAPPTSARFSGARSAASRSRTAGAPTTATPPGGANSAGSHLERAFQGLANRGGEGASFGVLGVRECARPFATHRRYACGQLTHDALVRELAPVRARFARLPHRGAACADRTACALSRDLIRRWESLRTFLRYDGVPPTNHASERALRGAVIHRKLSFGSKSAKGMRFLECIFSVNETRRVHGRNILDYLTQAMIAHRAGALAPRLHPTR